MEEYQRCEKCKSTNLEYKEDFIVRKSTKWWEWLFIISGVVFLFSVSTILALFVAVWMIPYNLKRKKTIYTYVCNDCGYTGKVK